MLKWFPALIFSLFLVFTLVPSGRADEITAAMQKDDARLQTHVTLRSPHILMGELLERLSRQSGVTLTADDETTAGSDAVTVSLRDVPLADAMNALWSLFSYKHAEWDWRRSSVKGEKGKYVYTLARPQYARFLAERLKAQVQTDFEAQAQEMLNALNMPQDQLKEAAKNDFLLNSMVVDGRVGPGMRIFASLPADTQLSILRGGPPITISVSDLPPQAQKSLQEARTWQAAKFASDHVPEEMIKKGLGPEPTRIGIGVDRSPQDVAPALFIDAGRGSGDYIGGGFMETPWRQKMNTLWMQPGDKNDDPTAAARALAPPQPSPALADGRHALAHWLLQFSDEARTPLIARIPRGLGENTQGFTLADLAPAKTVGAFLTGAGKQTINLQHKWRGGVLLLACQNWFMEESEDARLPWAGVRRLRDAEATGDGFLSLNDLAHAAHVLNAAQMRALDEWFPVMINAANWHDILAYFDKTPDYRPLVLSSKGIDYQYAESLVNSQLHIDALRVTHPNLRLKIREKQELDRKPPAHEIMFLVGDRADNNVLSGQGFGYSSHEYQSRLKVDEGTPTEKKTGTTR